MLLENDAFLQHDLKTDGTSQDEQKRTMTNAYGVPTKTSGFF